MLWGYTTALYVEFGGSRGGNKAAAKVVERVSERESNKKNISFNHACRMWNICDTMNLISLCFWYSVLAAVHIFKLRSCYYCCCFCCPGCWYCFHQHTKRFSYFFLLISRKSGVYLDCCIVSWSTKLLSTALLFHLHIRTICVTFLCTRCIFFFFFIVHLFNFKFILHFILLFLNIFLLLLQLLGLENKIIIVGQIINSWNDEKLMIFLSSLEYLQCGWLHVSW